MASARPPAISTIASVTSRPVLALSPGFGSVNSAETRIAPTDATAITRMAIGGPCLPGGTGRGASRRTTVRLIVRSFIGATVEAVSTDGLRWKVNPGIT